MCIGGTVSFASNSLQNISVMFNSIKIKVNGSTVQADNILYNGTTYLPLRAISTLLNKDVVWDANTNTANINDRTGLAPSLLLHRHQLLYKIQDKILQI